MIPGECIPLAGEIELNQGRRQVEILVANTGDRPIQVGSHYHFYEVNSGLSFAREQAKGFRLNIPAGTAVRFEPGESKSVGLVKIAGEQIIYGGNGFISGEVSSENSGAAMEKYNQSAKL